ARSIRADSLSFNNDGTIKKVIPTFRGIGITKATSQIQIDRYSAKSEDGARIDFIDTADKFIGWKAILDKPNAWFQYNTVQFDKSIKKVSLKVRAEVAGTVIIRSGNSSGPVIAEINVPAGDHWKEITKPVSGASSGINHLVLQLKTGKQIETDWIKFQ
ncbi:MAG: carbohydrate-binding protein, partial [Chitinophagaceae bacterium]|nr:carbohydrate-binding protein [Chitinophagaceae bacterium]